MSRQAGSICQMTRSARSGRPLAECNPIKYCAMRSTGQTSCLSTNVSNCPRYIGTTPASYTWKRPPKRNSKSPTAIQGRLHVTTKFSNNDALSTPRLQRSVRFVRYAFFRERVDATMSSRIFPSATFFISMGHEADHSCCQKL